MAFVHLPSPSPCHLHSHTQKSHSALLKPQTEACCLPKLLMLILFQPSRASVHWPPAFQSLPASSPQPAAKSFCHQEVASSPSSFSPSSLPLTKLRSLLSWGLHGPGGGGISFSSTVISLQSHCHVSRGIILHCKLASHLAVWSVPLHICHLFFSSVSDLPHRNPPVAKSC